MSHGVEAVGDLLHGPEALAHDRPLGTVEHELELGVRDDLAVLLPGYM